MSDEARLLAEEAALLEAELELKEGLPHLYGLPWFSWAYDFFTTENKMAFLCAANQISKSSTQIRKCIEWATNQELWPRLWPAPGLPKPNLFWYLYPVSANASTEFLTKWQQFLPRGKYKDSKTYGWRAEYKNKEIHAIHFNSGVTVQFKSYKQGGFALQSSTVYAVFADEEMPIELFDELMLRLNATNGYFSMVFTATLGQEEWRQVIEPASEMDEKFPQAWKRQVSIYECMAYMDGSPGPWSEERINAAIARCSTQAQVQRRILGKFVKESGLIYEQFDVKRHMKEWHPVPASWLWYVAADIGSGKTDMRGQGHPGGILVMAVKPDFTAGRVVYCWRGDNMRTTAGDIYNKAEEIIKELNIQPVAKLYDWASADFGIIAARNGGGWKPANKSQQAGEDMVNTLFKHDMLFIYSKGQNGKLASELCSVNHETPKRKRKDDLCFAAGALVSTDRGPVPIEHVAVGDRVWTRAGLREVVTTMCREAHVDRYQFSCGEEIVCTPNHKFFTRGRGFVPADDLTLSDELVKFVEWQNPKQSFSMVSSSVVTRMQSSERIGHITPHREIIVKKESEHYIRRFGRLLLEKFQKVMSSITRTEIPSTIKLRISNAYRRQVMRESIFSIVFRPVNGITNQTWNELARRRVYGTPLLPESSGIGSRLLRLTRKESIDVSSVQFARKNSIQRTTGADQGIANHLADQQPPTRVPVYNITVKEEHEYFVNGILVANCDPLRSICMEVAWDWTVIQGVRPAVAGREELEKGLTQEQRDLRSRRGEAEEYERQEAEFNAEFEEINAMYEGN